MTDMKFQQLTWPLAQEMYDIMKIWMLLIQVTWMIFDTEADVEDLSFVNYKFIIMTLACKMQVLHHV